MAIKVNEQKHLDILACLLHSLSDTTRLSILVSMSKTEVRVADLVQELGLAQSTISAHIACLKDCNLVVGRVEGRKVFYSLAVPEVLDLLRDAEVILGKTNQAVAGCKIFGVK